METKTKVGIIGIGMVGSQVKRWFEERAELHCYDKFKGIGSLKEACEADILFVAVPTPYQENGEYDLSALDETIEAIPDGKTIVIKSTVNPGTTDAYQNKYPNKTFIFNPEFLTELTAWEDFIHPDMQILGVPHQGYQLASKIMLMLPKAPVMRVVSPIDAEWIKKIRNAFYAMKVIFFNQMYDIIEKSFPADYETIRSVVVEDPRIGNSHSFVFHKGFRGYGGPCLPKDTSSLIEYARRVGAPSELLEKVKEINDKLVGDKLNKLGKFGIYNENAGLSSGL